MPRAGGAPVVAAELTVDVFLSVDGWAGPDGLPGSFGCSGPDLQDWIGAEGAAEHVDLMGRRTSELLSGIPEGLRDDGWHLVAERQTVVLSRTSPTRPRRARASLAARSVTRSGT